MSIQGFNPDHYREEYKNIFIEKGNLAFSEKVKKNIEILQKCEVGTRLFKRMQQGRHPIYVAKGERDRAAAFSNDAFIRNKGCATLITWTGENSEGYDQDLRKVITSPDVSLFHEFCHAYHNQNGKNYKYDESRKCDRDVWTDPEELHVIEGFPSKNRNRERPKITERAYCEQMGRPVEFSHHCYNDNPPPHLKQSAIDHKITNLANRILFPSTTNPNSPPQPVVVRQISSQELLKPTSPLGSVLVGQISLQELLKPK